MKLRSNTLFSLGLVAGLAALTFFLVACFAFLGRILLHAVRGEADEAAALLGSSAGRPSPKDRR